MAIEITSNDLANTFKFTVNDEQFKIPDLGHVTNFAFEKMYGNFLENINHTNEEFIQIANQYLDTRLKDNQLCEGFLTSFNALGEYFVRIGKFQEAEKVWGFALDIVEKWEQSNKPKIIHKGTPYYFLARTVIAGGDTERGFIIMHQAFTEDIRTNGGKVLDNPAKKFVTLDYKQRNQFFYTEVRDTADFLDKLLDNYRDDCGYSLTLDEFTRRIFNIDNLRESVTFLVFTLSKVKSLIRKLDQSLRSNSLAGLIEVGILFDFSLIIDSLLHYKNRYATKNSYKKQIEYLSKNCGFSIHTHFGELNNRFNQDPAKMITDILSGTWRYADGATLSHIETDIALSYSLRNFSAHNIKSVPVIYEKFVDIFQRVINVLFFSVERLYS